MLEKYILVFEYEDNLYEKRIIETDSFDNLKDLLEKYSKHLMNTNMNKVQLLKEVTTEYGTRRVPMVGSIYDYIKEICPEILF